MPVIDVHTHVYSHEWFELLKQHGGPQYEVKRSRDYPAPLGIYSNGAPFATPQPGHFDYELRVAAMDEAGVDISIVTLTAPSCFWGTPEISLKAARLVNDASAQAQVRFPDRIRWMASVPWEHPQLALKELERACDNGAIGVMVLANINGRSLTEAEFAPIWQAIDDRGLPVLIHPTAPPGVGELDLSRFNLIAQIGFMFDTSLAVARMLYDGFLDRYPNTKYIVSHAGGTLPYLAGRMDKCYEAMESVREAIQAPPSEYLRRFYYDAVTYRQSSLEMCIDVGGADKVMYGSDYPHNIGDMKGCLARVDALPADQREAVRGGNALRIFKI
jgi:aminocarboxymuconate-semialdehyde decarboxylase